MDLVGMGLGKAPPFQRCPHCAPPKLYSLAKVVEIVRFDLDAQRNFRCERCQRLIQITAEMLLVKPRPTKRKAKTGDELPVADEAQLASAKAAFAGEATVAQGELDAAEQTSQDQCRQEETTRAMARLKLLERIREAALVGLTLGGRFKVSPETIGQGAAGQLFAGTDLQTNQPVAIKFHLDTAGDDEAAALPRQRVKRTYEIQRLVQGANVVAPLAIFTDTPYGYVTVEPYVYGVTMRSALGAQQTLRQEAAIDFGVQLSGVLERAWQNGRIVHRDVKPDNIMIVHCDGRDAAVLIDWGAARSNDTDGRDSRGLFPEEAGQVDLQKVSQTLTMAGMVVGTPMYMAPEQVLGSRVDCRTDIYGLAATLYHVVTGRPPFAADSLYMLLEAVKNADPAPADVVAAGQGIKVSATFAQVLAKALAKDPSKRYATPLEFAVALQQCRATTKRRGRRWLIWLSLCVLVITLLAWLRLNGYLA